MAKLLSGCGLMHPKKPDGSMFSLQKKMSKDPRTGKIMRHHVMESGQMTKKKVFVQTLNIFSF
jgi:hypothetical protein